MAGEGASAAGSATPLARPGRGRGAVVVEDGAATTVGDHSDAVVDISHTAVDRSPVTTSGPAGVARLAPLIKRVGGRTGDATETPTHASAPAPSPAQADGGGGSSGGGGGGSYKQRRPSVAAPVDGGDDDHGQRRPSVVSVDGGRQRRPSVAASVGADLYRRQSITSDAAVDDGDRAPEMASKPGPRCSLGVAMAMARFGQQALTGAGARMANTGNVVPTHNSRRMSHVSKAQQTPAQRQRRVSIQSRGGGANLVAAPRRGSVSSDVRSADQRSTAAAADRRVSYVSGLYDAGGGGGGRRGSADRRSSGVTMATSARDRTRGSLTGVALPQLLGEDEPGSVVDGLASYSSSDDSDAEEDIEYLSRLTLDMQNVRGARGDLG